MRRFISCVAILFSACFFIGAQEIEKKVSIPALKEGASRYFYVPFEVPDETKTLTVSYEYDKREGANVLDLGLFDSRFDPQEQSMRGFRGWSGGRRGAVFIADRAATNGYLAGEISDGTWRVILGLYKVAPTGVDVTIRIKFNQVDDVLLSEPNAEENKTFVLPALKKLPAPAKFGGYTWFRGDLHMHTFHSDGTWTIPLLIEWAQAAGLDFISLTEHNTASHHATIKRLAPQQKNLLVLRGEEVTTYGGHFNVWGLPEGEVIDFRVAPKDADRLEKSIEKVHRLGLLASLNHPTALCGGCDWSYGEWTRMDAVEVWNGAWDLQDEAALKKWDALLQEGKRLTIISSSDTHTPPLGENPPRGALALGAPINHAGMKNLLQGALLSAIRAGRVWVNNAPNEQELEFSASGNGKICYIGDECQTPNNSARISLRAKNFPAAAVVSIISGGQILFSETLQKSENVFTETFSIEKNSYFRVEVRDQKGGMLALTNPIYVRSKQ